MSTAARDPRQAAATLFGSRLPVAQRFAELLAHDGIVRGLIGPREADRIWERHLLNCAVLTDLLPDRAHVVDVGSGAGLPALVLAIRRPDLSVDAVEPLERRCAFLREAVDSLDLTDRVRVVRGRAEQQEVRALVGNADWVTARAVAPLDQLVRWCLPLLRAGGTLLALKGRRAAAELQQHADAIRKSGGTDARVVTREVPGLDDVVHVVSVRRRAGQKGSR